MNTQQLTQALTMRGIPRTVFQVKYGAKGPVARFRLNSLTWLDRLVDGELEVTMMGAGDTLRGALVRFKGKEQRT